MEAGPRHERLVCGKYCLGDQLGHGAYGTVFSATVKTTGRAVVVKRIDDSHHGAEGVPPTALREMSTLRELDHSNVIRLLDVEITEDRTVFLVFPRLRCDLGDYMYRRPLGRCRRKGASLGKPLPLKKIKTFMFQLLRGVAECHSHGILHRDLKPQNVLMDDHEVLKIADFGLARAVVVPIDYKLTPTVVTLWYRAPEILLGSSTYAPPVDVWSLGVMMAEMAMGRPVWPHNHQITLLLSMFNDLGTPTETSWPGISLLPFYHPFPAFPRPKNPAQVLCPALDALGADLLNRMLVFDPANRISALAALRHPWFQGVADTLVDSVDSSQVSKVEEVDGLATPSRKQVRAWRDDDEDSPLRQVSCALRFTSHSQADESGTSPARGTLEPDSLGPPACAPVCDADSVNISADMSMLSMGE